MRYNENVTSYLRRWDYLIQCYQKEKDYAVSIKNYQGILLQERELNNYLQRGLTMNILQILKQYQMNGTYVDDYYATLHFLEDLSTHYDYSGVGINTVVENYEIMISVIMIIEEIICNIN